MSAATPPNVPPEPARDPDSRGPTPRPPQTHKQLRDVFWACFPNVEEGSNSRKLKMEVFFRRRAGVPTQSYLEILEKELEKVGPGTIRGMHIKSVLVFAYAMRSRQTLPKAVELHTSMLTRDAWPAGTDVLRGEVVRDFLRFMVMRETRARYTRAFRLLPQLFDWYIDPANGCKAVLPFYPATRRTGQTAKCIQSIRDKEKLLSGRFYSLKKAGYFCGEAGEADHCERMLRLALPLSPSDEDRAEVLGKLSEFMSNAGRPAKALEYYQQAHKGDGDLDAKLHLANLFLKAGQKEEAEKILASIGLDGADNETLCKVGLFHFVAKQIDAAIDVLERCKLSFDGDAESYNQSMRAAYSLAVAYSRKQRVQNQRRILEVVLANRRTGKGFDTYFPNVCSSMLKSLPKPAGAK